MAPWRASVDLETRVAAGELKSGHPESNQGPSDACKFYSQMLYQLSYNRLAGASDSVVLYTTQKREHGMQRNGATQQGSISRAISHAEIQGIQIAG